MPYLLDYDQHGWQIERQRKPDWPAEPGDQPAEAGGNCPGPADDRLWCYCLVDGLASITASVQLTASNGHQAMTDRQRLIARAAIGNDITDSQAAGYGWRDDKHVSRPKRGYHAGGLDAQQAPAGAFEL